MNLQQQTQNVAAQGRFGDSMLLHVNPAEVAGLSQVMPLTINPETGQPEAFLPMLLPLLGSIGGTTLAGTLGLTAGKAALLGAIGSGLGTTIATGDVKKGLLSGLTSYGLGQVLNAGKTAAEAAKAGADVGTNVVQGGIESVANEALSTGAGAGAGAGAGSGLSAGLSAAGQQLMKPGTMIPLALGLGGQGVMQSQEDFQRAMSNLKNQDEDEYNRILAEHPEYVPMLQNQTFQRGGRTGEKLKKEFKPVAAIQAREIDPFFMAGLQGERAYLKNVNPSSGQIISGKSGYAFGSEGADAPMSAPFDPTQTAGYQSFYNAPREPYVLDPYTKQTFTKPEPPIRQPIIEPLTTNTQKTSFEQVSETLPVPPPEESRVAPFNPVNLMNPDSLNQIANILSPGMSREAREERDTGVPMEGMMDVTAPPMVASTPIMPTNEPMMMDTSGLSREEIESGAFDPSMMATPAPLPASFFDYLAPQPVTTDTSGGFGGRMRSMGGRGGGRRRKAEGGKTYPNEGLEALAKEAPEAVEAMGYQEGGIIKNEMMNDPIVKEAIDFMLGKSDDSSIVDKFLAKYGTEAYLQLRDEVLKSSAQNNQAITEGLIAGSDRGAMADDINGVMGGGDTQEKISVSQGEFIVPGDVVSMLGNGDTGSGSSALYGMMDRVRQTKTGTTQQAKEINPEEFLPA